MTALIVCLIGWALIGGIIAFMSILGHERPPLFVDVFVWIAGTFFMFLIHAHGG